MPMAWRARRTKLPGAVGMPIIDTAVLTGWIMFGRLFKFFLLATVLVLLVRMLFSRQQRHGLRGLQRAGGRAAGAAIGFHAGIASRVR